jgi:hypothetical protein
MRFFKRISLMLPMLLLALTSMSQVTTSTISGTVRNGTGAELEGATITATHTPTGTVYTAVSKKGGTFNLPGLRAGGPYTVKVEYVGLKTETVQDINLSLGDVYTMTPVLADATQSLTEVVVLSQRAKTATDKTGASTAIGQRQLTTLPTINRSLTDFTRLTPQGGASFNTAQSNSVGGRDGRFNNVTVDGANLNNNFGLSTDPLPGGGNQPISLDAIEQVSVSIAPVDVRQSNFTGGNIAAVTKSGTNSFKGSFYTYYKDQSFVGTQVKDVQLAALAATKTNIIGGTIGGPIIKNKLFFFLNYEYEKKLNPPGTSYSPTGGTGTGNISTVKIDSLAKLSNYLKSTYNYETGVYDNFPNFNSKNHKLLGRIDWNISNAHKLTLKYNELVSNNDVSLNSTSVPNSATGGPNTWTSQARFGANAMSFANSNYGFLDAVKSAALELNSNISNKFANQLIATYTHISATRTSPSSLFPFIDIIGDATKSGLAATYAGGARSNYMSVGYEPYSYNNDVQNKIFNITDNFTYYAGKHALTFGVSYEYQSVGNMFMPASQSYYTYGSLAEFMNPTAHPIAFATTFSRVPGKDAVYSAEMKIGQGSLYFQDEYTVSSKLKLTYGVRIDKPFYPEQPIENPSITALTFPDRNGKPTNYNTGMWPKATLYWSPRVGARWDIRGDKSEILRGSIGLYTGKLPFVYLTNMPTNSGMYQVIGLANASQLNSITFNPDPKAWQSLFAAPAPAPNSGGFVLIDPNYKYPQIFRTNLGYDRQLGKGWSFSSDFLISKDVNPVIMRNANETTPTGTVNLGGSSRPSFSANSNTARRLYSTYANAIVLENALKSGYALSITAQLEKRFSNGLYGSLAYTYSDASDLTANPGSTASSTWSGNPTSGTQNTQEFAPSAFVAPHRIVAFLSYRKEYLKHLASTFSLIYEGASQGRFSYIYGAAGGTAPTGFSNIADVNYDGNSSDLMYIPRNPSEITFTPLVVGTRTYSAQEQSDAFFRYMQQDKYLRSHAGQVAQRNGVQQPFYSKLDFRFLQEIFTNIGSRRNTLQLSFDCLNFLNLLNKSWGIRDFFVVNNPLRATKNATTGEVRYQMATYTPNGTTTPVLVDKTYIDNISTTSTYSIQIGLQYKF